MNRFSKVAQRIAFVGLLVFAAADCRADEASQHTSRMENRFLFVIDTSAAMKSRTNGIEEAVAGLLGSDMRGEFRKGDTIGIWSYDEDIHADFPMQVWSPGSKEAIDRDVIRFLRHQRYQKRPHLEKVLGAISRIMANSDRLTLIFVYDGSEAIRGTIFDKDINDLQKNYAHQFRKRHIPMVTILTARNGQVFDYTINYPGAMTVPHTAIDLPPQPTNAPSPTIVATNSAPEEPKAPRRKIEIVMSGSHRIDTPEKSAEVPVNDSITAQTKPIVTPADQPQPPATGAALAPVMTAGLLLPSKAPVPERNTDSVVPQQAAPSAHPEPLPVAPAAPPRVQPISRIETMPSASSTPSAASPPSAVATTNSEAAMTSISRGASPPPNSVASTSPLVHEPSPVVAPVMDPMATPISLPSNSGQQIALFVIAFSLLTIAVSLVVFLVRRSRGVAPSLISQSMDRGH